MSSSSKSVLLAENAALKIQIAERDAKIAEMSAVKPAKRAKSPKERDPDAVRMLSPYLVFCAAQRAAHTGAEKLTLKELGVAWKLLGDEQRLSYKPVPAPKKEPKEPKAPKKAPAEGTPVKKEKKVRDPAAPKKPLSGFMLFSKQERAKTPDLKLKANELAERWHALSDEARVAFKSS